MPALDIQPLTEGDEPALVDVLERSFNVGLERWQLMLRRLGRQSIRVARAGGTVVGGWGYYQIGHYFGGRAVPAWGLGAVGVAPERRGRGIATEMMVRALREIRAAGVPFGSLHPATTPLYRKVGYEHAGVYARLAVDCDAIESKKAELPITRLPKLDRAVLEPLYARWAAQHNGTLVRNDALWERLGDFPGGAPVEPYVFGDSSHPEGYLCLARDRDGWKYALELRDWVCLTPAALRTAWSFLSGMRSLATQVRWHGPPHDARAALLPEWSLQVVWQRLFMLRVVDTARALALRGWNSASSGELHLDVADELIPENAGRLVLTARDGAASVEPGGRGSLRLDVRALPPLYSGLLPASRLALLGWVQGDERSLALADAMFAGPTPFITDMY